MANPRQIESINSGSNYKFGDKMTIANTPRSLFDLTHLNTLTINNAGEVIPIDLIETLPNDDFDITVDSLIRVLPQTVPLYSRQRMYIYAFYSRGGDLWTEFNTFMTKGYTGNEILKIPTIQQLDNDYLKTLEAPVQPNSLADYLGIPINTKAKDIGNINSLPLMMYLRIWRDYFINKNFYTEDRTILPNNDADFRLNKNGKIQSFEDKNGRIHVLLGKSDNGILFENIGLRKEDDTTLTIGKFCHDYPQDYFTSALPWAQRGNQPTINLNVTNSDININFDNILGTLAVGTKPGTNITDLEISYRSSNHGASGELTDASIYSRPNENGLFSIREKSPTTDTYPYIQLKTPNETENTGGYIFPRLNGTQKANITGAIGTITLNQIRELAIAQTELEKMARTDGSYGEFGLTFFGEKSKRADDYKPVYIGGSVTNLQFTEVVQQSESGTTPLGTYAGHGIATQTDGYLGHIHCDDYGYIMILACIMPDVYYSQGLDKKFTRLYQSQYYLPERAKLGLQPILNQELFFSGNKTQDENLWAYQNPYDEYRYKNNEIHGKIADNTNLSFYPYTQARHFPTLPNWSEEFANANEVRKDYLAAKGENAYTAQFNIQIRAVRPLPYKPIPAQILN